MFDRPHVNDCIPNGVLGQGMFSALQALDVPWKDENISTSLDLEYHGNFSGDKYISPLLYKLLPDDSSELSADTITQIAQAIYNLNIRNWDKLWSTLTFNYDPIENYRMMEQMTDDETVTEYGKTRTRTDNLSQQRVDNLTHSKTGTESDERDRTDATANDIYGFNSSDASPADKSDVTVNDDNTHTYAVTDTDTGTETTTNTGTQADAETGSDTQTRNYTLTRSGNIGVTTSQQMIQSERDLWLWNFFYDIVFPDIDRILTIQIY